MIDTIKSHLSYDQKVFLKKWINRTDKFVSRTVFRYGSPELKNALQQLGVERGDTLLVHSKIKFNSGFSGNPQDVIDCVLDVIGEEGNLLMMSLPYGSSTLEYLQKNEVFDVKKTPSRMGIITEIFRRKKGVVRSLHPGHPVLAYGKDAGRIVKDHEKCLYSCGKGSPFDAFTSLDGKILFFDTTFRPITYIHYIEDLIKDRLPFPLYTAEPISSLARGYDGKEIVIKTFPFDRFVFENRNSLILGKYMEKDNRLKRKKLGRTELILIKAEEAIRCTYKMLGENRYFYRGLDG